MRIPAVFVFLLLFLACTNRQPANPYLLNKDIVITNDCENAPANVPLWINKETVVKGNSLSGDLSSYLDSLSEFSYGFESQLKTLHPAIPDSAYFSAELYSTEPDPEIYFVIDISLNGKKLSWNSCKVCSQLNKKSGWNQVSARFKVPEGINPDAAIKLFAWNPKKQIAWLDDFTVRLRYK